VVTDQLLRLEQIGPAALITLNRPEVLNALSFGLLEQLDAALDELRGSGSRVLVVTGAGDRAFCAGADIAELRHRPPLDCKRGIERGQAIFQKLEELPIPSIAAINGYAFGGGLELALACTLRVATRRARMGCPEIKLGLIPAYGGTQRLPRLVGPGRAQEMILTGASVEGERAEAIGLVNRVVDGDVVAPALEMAGQLAAYSLPVVDLARRAVLRAGDTSLMAGLAAEAELATISYALEDAAEGMTAFVEKHQPRFKDR
jgi:enoyl-CoA hydratase